MAHTRESSTCPKPHLSAGILFVFFLSGIMVSVGNAKFLDSQQGPEGRSEIDADQLAKEVMRNEVQAQSRDHSLWSYLEIQQKNGHKRVMRVCQTREGEIDQLIAMDGKKLTSQQLQAEEARIRKLITHPDLMRRAARQQHEDAEQAQDMMNIFPDAFRFRYDGMEGNLVRLAFTPNPTFHPSGHAEQVFHRMAGSLLVDEQQKRLAEIQGRLTSSVKFGDGVLGHLDEGGTFFVKQQDLEGGHWAETIMNVRMNGKVLFFKTISVNEQDTYTHFERVPATITVQRAAELLAKDTDAPEALHN